MKFWGPLVLSFIVVAFGQSAWIPFLSIGAAACGYAFFWRAMLEIPSQKSRFWLSTLWFACVQAVQISWMTSTQYMGPLILFVYAILSFAMGLQFGALSFFFDRKTISLRGCFAVAGCWVFMEWMRVFCFSGFTWNPVALALADSPTAIQMAALFGVYGLSFWVIFVNAFAISALDANSQENQSGSPIAWFKRLFAANATGRRDARGSKKVVAWGLCAAFPYLFGWAHQSVMEKIIPQEKPVTAALVQTALLPEQKDYLFHRASAFIPPLDQWQVVWNALRDDVAVDLIILPEAVVSMGANQPFYPVDLVRDAWSRRFGQAALADLPPLEAPLAYLEKGSGGSTWKVTNAFLATALANHFRAGVIAGLEDQERDARYNAAFHFVPNGKAPQRIEKRILVPIGEYLPFPNIGWLNRFVFDRFGISGSFDMGKEAKLFADKTAIGVSICLEETYSHLVRDLRLKGARLFVNISNDIWFPESRLPLQHFQHGRIRAAEHGVYVLRSCNTGITGGIDCFGKVIATLPPSETDSNALYLSFSPREFPTLYTWVGDWAILIAAGAFAAFGLHSRRNRDKP